MTVLFSKSCEYATQAMLYLAWNKGSEPVLLRTISYALQIPHSYLNKVMQLLARDGLVVSQKGANGGFTLGRDTRETTLLDIVRAVDGDAFMNGCVLGFPKCDDSNPCPVHSSWLTARNVIVSMLGDKTVHELGSGLAGKLEMIERLKLP